MVRPVAEAVALALGGYSPAEWGKQTLSALMPSASRKKKRQAPASKNGRVQGSPSSPTRSPDHPRLCVGDLPGRQSLQSGTRQGGIGRAGSTGTTRHEKQTMAVTWGGGCGTRSKNFGGPVRPREDALSACPEIAVRVSRQRTSGAARSGASGGTSPSEEDSFQTAVASNCFCTPRSGCSAAVSLREPLLPRLPSACSGCSPAQKEKEERASGSGLLKPSRAPFDSQPVPGDRAVGQEQGRRSPALAVRFSRWRHERHRANSCTPRSVRDRADYCPACSGMQAEAPCSASPGVRPWAKSSASAVPGSTKSRLASPPQRLEGYGSLELSPSASREKPDGSPLLSVCSERGDSPSPLCTFRPRQQLEPAHSNGGGKGQPLRVFSPCPGDSKISSPANQSGARETAAGKRGRLACSDAAYHPRDSEPRRVTGARAGRPPPPEKVRCRVGSLSGAETDTRRLRGPATSAGDRPRPRASTEHTRRQNGTPVRSPAQGAVPGTEVRESSGPLHSQEAIVPSLCAHGEPTGSARPGGEAAAAGRAGGTAPSRQTEATSAPPPVLRVLATTRTVVATDGNEEDVEEEVYGQMTVVQDTSQLRAQLQAQAGLLLALQHENEVSLYRRQALSVSD